jgi:hypothetical protein
VIRGGLAIATLAGALLAGCESRSAGSEESNQYCHTIANLAIACTGCSQVSDAGNAFDGKLATAAAVGAGGQGTFLGTSRSQPAGSIAGVYFTLTNPAGVSITLTTFLDGEEQETGTGPATRQGTSSVCPGGNMECSFTDGGASWVGMETTAPYDAIEATISNSSASTLQINELCVR